MKMYGVFAVVPAPSGTPGDLDGSTEHARAVAESDKNPVALCRYGDTAETILKSYSNGQMEIREVDVPTFEVITRRPVKL